MTHEEAAKLLAMIKVAYPTAYRDMDKDMAMATVNMWHKTFPDVPYPIIEMAFERYRRANKFAPTVADIYEELKHVYYAACTDALVASAICDEEMQEKSEYIMRHTASYKDDPEATIDYNRITSRMLMDDVRGQYQITDKS